MTGWIVVAFLVGAACGVGIAVGAYTVAFRAWERRQDEQCPPVRRLGP